jgi:hypothetical protein
VSEERPPEDGPLRHRTRLPFEEKPFRSTVQRGAVFVYAVLTAGLLGLALYMWQVVGHPLTSGYVAAPAIGALWFGLRLFMLMGSRK